jgi:hypothetical protein
MFLVSGVNAQEIPALLRVKKSEQPDSLGYNMVDLISKLTYKLILQNKIKLWDSPNKDIQITATSLIEIERASSTSFTDQEVIYIYEKWIASKKEIQSKCIGISFSNKDSRNQEVSYGYVDFDELSKYAMETIAEVNANGNYGESVGYYLLSKGYAFNLVQFNNKVIQSVTESQQAIKSFKGKLKFNSPSSVLNGEEAKYVVYQIDTRSSTDTLFSYNSRNIFRAVEEYLITNKEEFFNLGGDKLQNFVNGKQKLKVTGIEVTEVWKKNRSQLYYEPRKVCFYVNDSALNTITVSELAMMDIEVDQQKLILTLLDKKFNYYLTRINSQDIPRRDSYTYLKALQAYKWNQITEFVKYY